MSIYQLLLNAKATATQPAQLVSTVGSFAVNATVSTSFQFWAKLTGIGTCSATIAFVGSNDGGQTFQSLYAPVTLSGAAVDLTPVVQAWSATAGYELFGAYITAISGTNATVNAWMQDAGAGTFPIPASLVAGQAKIATAGTAQVLSATATGLVNGLVITAPSGNAGSVTIGGPAVTNTVDGTGNGYILAAGASVQFPIPVANLNDIWINGTNTGDKISYLGN